jgi:hypothetical protein
LPKARREGVELGDVGPRRELGIAAAGDDGVTHRDESRRIGSEVLDCALHEVLGMIREPSMSGAT